VRIEFLDFEGCPHGPPARALLDDVLARLAPDAELVHHSVGDAEHARRLDFRGSPSIRIDGHDLEGDDAPPCGMGCRVYGDAGVPPRWLVEAAVLRALRPRHLLMLCVANSARSQLAEGIARSMAGPGVTIASAGSDPTSIRPEAVTALQELGIDPSGQESAGMDSIDLDRVDAVITLCAEEVCPIFPAPVPELHWGLPDPAEVEGPGRLDAFRSARDELVRRLGRLLPLLLLVAVVATGCRAVTPEPEPVTPTPRPLPPPSINEEPDRLVALGDIHGDHDAMNAALSLAGVIDDDGHWSGGETVVVQTGDQLDRGDDERAILDHLEQLTEEAWAAGGMFHVLNGNHETMNVELDLRYVTDGGFADFADLAPPIDEQDEQLLAYAETERGRVFAFRPGGLYASMLAGRNTTVQVGDTVFVHGGVLPDHADIGLEAINGAIQEWMAGDGDVPDELIGGDGVVWVRNYSDGPSAGDCTMLDEALEILGASRMVVGHTVQDEVSTACDEKVWLVDVGMAAYYGGSPAAIEIRDGEVTVLD
jgi:protein-tyrosine-phosphatase